MGGNAQNKYVHLVDEAEGLDKIEDLQNHEQEEIYDKAANILEAFFDVEDGEVENLAPQVRSPWVPQAFAGCCASKLSAKAKAACMPARHKLQGANTVLTCRSGLTRLLELQMGPAWYCLWLQCGAPLLQVDSNHSTYTFGAPAPGAAAQQPGPQQGAFSFGAPTGP